MSVLRAGLLVDRAVALVGAAGPVRASLAELGARVELLDPRALPDEEEQVGNWARARSPLTAVVFDARGLGMTEALESAWIVVREVAVGALIPGEAPGKVVLIAPPDGAGSEAAAVRAGLENLSRTLSVEWARYRITTVTVAVGAHASDEELAELVCFLCSPGGEYLSGCRLDLGALSV
jgi:NAD(P)-dependent dehydrogenase (short-subunit alcohol dehydrogenase family)